MRGPIASHGVLAPSQTPRPQRTRPGQSGGRVRSKERSPTVLVVILRLRSALAGLPGLGAEHRDHSRVDLRTQGSGQDDPNLGGCLDSHI